MRRIFKSLFAAACILFTASAFILLGYYKTNQTGSREYKDLAGKVTAPRQQAKVSQGVSYGQPDNYPEELCVQAGELKTPPALFVDFEALKAINEDTEGWIDFPGQQISYPVVRGDDNSRYLKYTFEGKQNAAGCVFADARNKGLMRDGNTIIYGHNMRNGSMFGLLKNYMKQEHYEKFPFFDLYVPEGIYRCEIIACCRVRALEDNYPVVFAGESEKEAFIKEIRDKSEYEIPLSETPQAEKRDTGHTTAASPLVMLSTCVGGQKQYRFVVMARAVRVVE